LLDFAATATGTVKIDTLSLYFANNPSPTYFYYEWLTAVPSGVPASAYPTLANAQDSSSQMTDNTFTGATPGILTWSSVSGSGRYLLIGAVNGSLSTSNYFQVNSVTYTSVPDGASTLALMGAAVATLGLAARRRKQ
jgi:hypothetical protein